MGMKEENDEQAILKLKAEVFDLMISIEEFTKQKNAKMQKLAGLLKGKKIDSKKYKIAQSDSLEKEIKKLVKKNKNLIKEKGDRSIGPLMGDLMKKFKGKLDAKKASDLLKEEIKNI